MFGRISCVCLTISGREKFLTRAIDCFNRQTYPERELIIVADPGADPVRLAELSPTAAIVVCPAKLSVGTKRNIGCEWAAGDLIAVWDDDDYSAPHRLARQLRILTTFGKSVTVLDQIYYTDSECRHWWLSHPGWIDTSLFFTRQFWERHKFPDKILGQDADFIRQAVSEDTFHLDRDPRMMFATNHPGNTCDRTCMYGPENELKHFEWKD